MVASPWAALAHAFVGTYDVKDVFEADALVPSAVAVLGALPAAKVYDEAVGAGVPCLGVASVHRRAGKFVAASSKHPDAERVYVGPAKPPAYPSPSPLWDALQELLRRCC